MMAYLPNTGSQVLWLDRAITWPTEHRGISFLDDQYVLGMAAGTRNELCCRSCVLTCNNRLLAAGLTP